MVLLTSCCCWKSVRSGSLACGIYALVFYMVLLTASSFHIQTVKDEPIMLLFTVLMVIFSCSCVVSSIILIIGICSNRRQFLVPWLCSMTLLTIFDLVLSFYLILEGIHDEFVVVVFIIDLLICALNIYCLFCVYSLYQTYCNAANQNMDATQQVHFAQNPGGGTNGKNSSYLSVPKFSTQVTDEGVSTAVSSLPSYQQRLSVSRSGTINEESRHLNGYSDVTLLPVDSRSVSPTNEQPAQSRVKADVDGKKVSEIDRASPEEGSHADEGRSTVSIRDTQPLLGQRTTKESNPI